MNMKKIVSNGVGLAAAALTAYGGVKLAERACDKLELFDNGTEMEAAASGAFCGIPIALVSGTAFWATKSNVEAIWDLAATLLKKLD